MKFYAQSTQAIYLSQPGSPPPPLRVFDVFYQGYPQVGFSVIGSLPTGQSFVSVVYPPQGSRDFKEQDWVAPEDPILEQYTPPETGAMEVEQPMHIPGQAPVLTPFPTEQGQVEAQIEWIEAQEDNPNAPLKPVKPFEDKEETLP